MGGMSDWLKNSSYTTKVNTRSSPVSSDDESLEIWKTYADHKFGAAPLVAAKPKAVYPTEVRNIYFEFKSPDSSNLMFGTLPAKRRPEYFYMRTSLGFLPHDFQPQKKETVVRYYSSNSNQGTNVRETPKKLSSFEVSGSGASYVPMTSVHSSTSIENEHMAMTKEFNEKLAASPNDVDLWLRYIKFHDIAQHFENSAKYQSKYAICQKKLSVVEKALELNPHSIELLREKLALMPELYLADQIADKIESLLNKDPDNVNLWQALILVAQSSVAGCTVPKIMKIYTKCFDALTHRCKLGWEERDRRLLGEPPQDVCIIENLPSLSLHLSFIVAFYSVFQKRCSIIVSFS